MGFSIDRGTRRLALGVVVISALVMGYILYELGKTKQHFAVRLIEQSSERIQSKLGEFFLPIENLMLAMKQQNVQALQNFDPVFLNSYFIPLIDQYPQISSIGFAHSGGYEFNVLPDTVTGYWLNREVDVGEWGMTEQWNRWSFEDRLIHVRKWKQELRVDPRERPWFTEAIKEKGRQIHWTEPYLYMTDELGITASLAWQSEPEDSLLHILALDVTLQDLTRFSQNLTLTKNDQVFILTKTDKNIIGLSQAHASLTDRQIREKLLSAPEELATPALTELLKQPQNQIVSFKSQNQRWWGIVKTYSINPTQELLIAVIIPEDDFSYEIDSTRNAIIGGFMFILLLSFLLFVNQNKLKKISSELNKKNKLVTEQKERLFIEIHHRVKNNLAVMTALMELENMESEDPAVKQVLSQIQRRIKSMAAVHEVLYKSDDMSRVLVHDFIPGILNFSKKAFTELEVEITHEIEPALINVNQALTYGLLLNECLSSILKSGLALERHIEVRVSTNENRLTTEIKIDSDADYLHMGRGVGRQLIEVLLAQLESELVVKSEDERTLYHISFELKNKKGITSNLNY